jgi:LysM domain.
MKTVLNISRTALCLLVLAAFATTAHALTPGPTIIRECPGCKKPLREFTIGSGNTIGAKWWTDGKVDAPMLRMGPALVKCPHCQTLFWIADAKKLAELSWSDDEATRAKWDKATDYLYPVEKDYLTAAQVAGVSREHELLDRKQAWWLANDESRGRAGRSIIWSSARQENLQKLSALLDEKIEHEVILKAEIARELGQFGVCSNLLAAFDGKECECESYATFVRKLAGERKSAVELLPPVDDQQRGSTAESEKNPQPPAAGDTYTVREGDTLIEIARQHGVTLKTLTEANPGVVPARLRIGQTLKLR